jgi:hypothetical protein
MIKSQVVRVSKAEMMCALHLEPPFSELFMTHLLMRNGAVEKDLVDPIFNSSGLMALHCRHPLARTHCFRLQWPGTLLPFGGFIREFEPLERSQRQQGASSPSVGEIG